MTTNADLITRIETAAYGSSRWFENGAEVVPLGQCPHDEELLCLGDAGADKHQAICVLCGRTFIVAEGDGHDQR